MRSRIAQSEGVSYSIPFVAVEQSSSLRKRQVDARVRSSLTRSTSMWRLGAGSSTQARPRFSLCGAIPLMKSPRLGSETLLPKGLFENGPRMPERFRRVRTGDLQILRPSHILIETYLDDCSTGECRYSEAPLNHS